MKRIIWLVIILLIVFLGLVYLSVSGQKEEFDTAVIIEPGDVDGIDFTLHDSVTVAASSLYKGNLLKETMQGKNYREAWETPVTIPVVFLDTLFGGMTIVKEGGGTQTHSLRMEDARGILYSLRSINKDPQSHVPEFARTLGLQNIVIDGISAQHPYGAVAAAALADVAGVLHTHPRPVFVPKQKLLGEYNEKYGNRLYLLEFETEGVVNWTPYQNVKEILDTDDLQELKAEVGDRLSIDRHSLIRARLFDLLIGDWDRHAKQWGWVIQEVDGQLTAISLPGDRDNAFFKLEGVIPTIISHRSVEPLVRPFEKEIDYMPGLVYPVDVYFLKNTPVDIYETEAAFLQQALTNEKITAALKMWNEDFYRQDGKEIAAKIIQRRENLMEYAMAFRKIVEERDWLKEPLKGSEDIDLPPGLIKCFECLEQ
ncbi:hypothetical protein FHG64_04635 [Antarcticibacterium flavum]|uniref:Uncharacterized protein n=1 Tax=Antarcticibacterium flavum TaxID=2058175 RepID=A0A5B7X282_9FLAO|nr:MULTISPECIES: hypothetical protein [Antarcticibacterium]MCM4160184.1 hypothetical protein [Antarcticibacterium sp. W02-3]QCY68738.1 hypothetical protein FHG64_04635 [Antarcticibacterium flavum]